MKLLALTLFEIIYLFYMYFIFKTNYSFSSAIFDKQVQSLGSFFMHDTGRTENKICLFGKFMAIIAIILAIIRLYFINNYPDYRILYKTLIFDISCLILASIMNLNALIYVIPIILIELYIVTVLVK